MTAEQVRELLRARLAGRTHAAMAAEIGVTQGYLSKVLAGDCNPGEKLLRQMGLRKVTRYEPANVGDELHPQGVSSIDLLDGGMLQAARRSWGRAGVPPASAAASSLTGLLGAFPGSPSGRWAAGSSAARVQRAPAGGRPRGALEAAGGRRRGFVRVRTGPLCAIAWARHQGACQFWHAYCYAREGARYRAALLGLSQYQQPRKPRLFHRCGGSAGLLESA